MKPVIKAILERKSIRTYQDKKIEKEKVDLILKAGLAGPSACNARPFEFIVIDDSELLNKIADGNGKSGTLLKKALLGIVVCMNFQKAVAKAPLYADVDCSIACQNMILAAYELGIGSCWLGTYPQDEKMGNQKEILGLPDHIEVHSIIAFGYPEDENNFKNEKERFEKEKIHYNKW